MFLNSSTVYFPNLNSGSIMGAVGERRRRRSVCRWCWSYLHLSLPPLRGLPPLIVSPVGQNTDSLKQSAQWWRPPSPLHPPALPTPELPPLNTCQGRGNFPNSSLIFIVSLIGVKAAGLSGRHVTTRPHRCEIEPATLLERHTLSTRRHKFDMETVQSNTNDCVICYSVLLDFFFFLLFGDLILLFGESPLGVLN